MEDNNDPSNKPKTPVLTAEAKNRMTTAHALMAEISALFHSKGMTAIEIASVFIPAGIAELVLVGAGLKPEGRQTCIDAYAGEFDRQATVFNAWLNETGQDVDTSKADPILLQDLQAELDKFGIKVPSGKQ